MCGSISAKIKTKNKHKMQNTASQKFLYRYSKQTKRAQLNLVPVKKNLSAIDCNYAVSPSKR